jgi:hypothetical protein
LDARRISMAKSKHPLYKIFEKPAKAVKISFEMLVGLGLLVLLILKIVHTFSHMLPDKFALIIYIANHGVLDIIGEGLAVTAGIELIYMLFTPGPDETIQPLIYGVASAILIIVSNKYVNNENIAFTILILTVVLGILFYLKKRYFPNIDDDEGKTTTYTNPQTSVQIPPNNQSKTDMPNTNDVPLH